MNRAAKLKPPALREGDTVGIIAPASAIDRDLLEAGCSRLRQMGYRPEYLESIVDRDLYFAGSLQGRVNEFHEMFRRDDVKAVLCARGGYGCAYLLPRLNMELVRSHPKVFVGYSDVTALLTYLNDAAGLITFHGPMVVKDFAVKDGVDMFSWLAATGGETSWQVPSDGMQSLIEGHAEGVLYGGCLSMLVASLGTPYEVRTEGAILFLEDVGVKPYQLDRMLLQLKQAGKLDGVRGIVFGQMSNCVQPGGQDYTLEEVLTRAVSDLKVPVAYGLRSGHVASGNITLPLGVGALLETGKTGVSLRILEAGSEAVSHTSK